ncbi:Pkinase-domain-containing protein [Lichtheimia hyalospora FSU 10163]|nr:Pkinase-domain-containing protein [Lichtheimia hyalospora FSU 10163]
MGKTKASYQSGHSVPKVPDPASTPSLLTPPGSTESTATTDTIIQTTSSGSPVRTSSSSRSSKPGSLSVRSKNSISKHSNKKGLNVKGIKGPSSMTGSAKNDHPLRRSQSYTVGDRMREMANADKGPAYNVDDPDLIGILHCQYPKAESHTLHDRLGKNKSQNYLIGSGESCDIRLSGLERKHCIIYPTFRFGQTDCPVNLHILDRSDRGTWVGKQRLKQGRTQLEQGNEIIFKDASGNIQYCFKVFIPSGGPMHERGTFQDIYFDTDHSLGQGTFGRVKKIAHRKDPTKIYACKTINVQKFKKEHTSIRMLYTEVGIQLQLQIHPCVLKIERVLESATELYIIMEYGKDGDLFEYLQRNQATEDEIRIIFDQIFHAVAYMHRNEMVHRDLKLENVIVSDKDKLHVKLGDFGMSRFNLDNEQHFDTACGTIIYCAPERLLMSESPGTGVLYNKSVDVWSLGVMLYAALAHSMPFNANDIESPEGRRVLENMIRAGKVSFQDAVWHRVSADAKDLILRMLETDHAKRPTMAEVLGHRWLDPSIIENERTELKGLKRCPELVSFLNSPPLPLTPSSQPPSPSPSPSPSRSLS